jgi:uncharacterized protein (TIGR03067 family)
MKYLASVGTALVLLASGVATFAQDAEKPSKNPLLGEYVMVSGKDNGETVPEERIKGNIVRITDDTITAVDRDEKEIYVAKYMLDTTHTPYKIMMTIAGGPRDAKGDKAEGIVELKGETLRMAYAYAGGDVPKDFKSIGKKQLEFTMTVRKKDD